MTPDRDFIHEAGKRIREAIESVPTSPAITAAAAANGMVGIEAYRTVPFEDLPADVIEQLRGDGTHDGPARNLEDTRAVYEHNVPAEARGSVDGVEAVTNDPSIHWMHKQPYAAGGGSEAANGVYGPSDLNQAIGDRPMTSAEVQQADTYNQQIAEQATPGVTGDLPEVVGDTLETGALGGVMCGGIAAVHRMAQAQGYRDAGRPDLAAMAEEKIVEDVTNGAMNGVMRGTTVAVTQAVLGANPVTAGIGLVVPDAVALVTQRDRLSQEEYNLKATEVVAKGALATALVCAGPIGWIGLAGVSIASAYNKARMNKMLDA